MKETLIGVAHTMLDAKLSVFPAVLKDKFPTGLPWAKYQKQRMHPSEVDGYFAAADAICIICGEGSENVESLDFDDRGSCFSEWAASLDDALFMLLVIEKSPAGGYHVYYRCQTIAGNLKLAKKVVWCDGPDEVELDGKKYKPRRHGSQWYVDPVLIETRGQGGLILCAPSPGYTLIHGKLTEIPTITVDQREQLLAAARAFDQSSQVKEQPVEAKPAPVYVPPTADAEFPPWTDYNERGDVRGVLQRAGWTQVRGPVPGDDNERWRRPGKEDGHSATLGGEGRIFFCWTGNGEPFQETKGYSPFQVYVLLEHNGNVGAAVNELKRQGFGRPGSPVDLSYITRQGVDCDEPDEVAGDIHATDVVQQTLPPDLLSPDGFLADVMSYTLETSLYPQPEIALAGAISLLSVLTGRKVCDAKNTRTNVYVLTVNPARSGKERSREVNKEILYECNGQDMIGNERIGSHAGIITAVSAAPAILFQIDELGRLLATCRDPRSSHLYNIASVLLTLYSSATSVWKADAYADKKKEKVIVQPHCVVCGTTTAETLWPNLSRDNVADGLIGRLLIFEGRGYVDFNEAFRKQRVPNRIVQAGQWWTQYTPGGPNANLGQFFPEPAVIPHTPGAEKAYLDHVREVNNRRKSENAFRAAVWSGTAEKTAKLALIHACSREYGLPKAITERDLDWGKRLANYLTRRMLTSCSESLSENDTHAKYQKVLKTVGNGRITKSALGRKLQWLKARERDEMIKDLIETGQLDLEIETTAGRSRVVYYRPTTPRKQVQSEGVC